MRETRTLEFKEKLTNTFLKTVSAFANYDGGTILFGFDDNGKNVGIEEIEETCIKIENKINTMIKPQPDYSLSTHNRHQTIELTVRGDIKRLKTLKLEYLFRKFPIMLPTIIDE